MLQSLSSAKTSSVTFPFLRLWPIPGLPTICFGSTICPIDLKGPSSPLSELPHPLLSVLFSFFTALSASLQLFRQRRQPGVCSDDMLLLPLVALCAIYAASSLVEAAATLPFQGKMRGVNLGGLFVLEVRPCPPVDIPILPIML